MSSVSPDGQWFALAGQKNSGQLYNQDDNQIWLVDSTDVSKMLEVQPLHGRTPSRSPSAAARSAFSPDGHRLAFAMGDPAKNVTTIALVTLPDGS